ncbi:MAG: hypothetical protein O2924_00065 [Chloroflexi bacterium]|nr:hypothetical protein [Chloroflexota bacterium]MQC16610.1 hypothetical protein [Chloroflexota bacterium]
MGILDKLLGRKKESAVPQRPLSKAVDSRTDEEKDAVRTRMESELQTSKDDRSDRASASKESAE